MKQGTLYIQDRGRETKVKTLSMAALLAGLWLAMRLPQFQIAVLAVLALWAALSKALMDKAKREDWFHREAPWYLTDEEVTVDGRAIPRNAIKRTMCIPRPGIQRKMFRGWVLKIETQDKIYEWYSYYQDVDNQKSVESLQKLAQELGTEWQAWIKA